MASAMVERDKWDRANSDADASRKDGNEGTGALREVGGRRQGRVKEEWGYCADVSSMDSIDVIGEQGSEELARPGSSAVWS